MRRYHAGFTLIELLIAIFIMSLLALLSWRGIDGMSRAQDANREHADQIATLQTALSQWQTDLDQMLRTEQTSAIDYNGRLLRITRRYGDDELRVVGWTQRDVEGKTRWLRWQSKSLNSRAELSAAWLQALQWAQNPGDLERNQEVAIAAIDDWQIFFYRNDSWTNPLSSAAVAPGNPAVTAAPGATLAVVPDGVRLVLKLTQGQVLTGTLTRDWIRPIIGGGKT
ncbi:MAG: prepilin-type N-terminal cleavage/methylation domain-containing protein [Burkholderiaceae bacterium]